MYSRWTEDFSVKNTTSKLLTKNISKEFLDFGIQKDFLNNADKSSTVKNIDQLDFSLCLTGSLMTKLLFFATTPGT